MKKLLLFLICTSTLNLVHASYLNTGIYDVIEAESADEKHLVLANSGDVFEVANDDLALLEQAIDAKESRLKVEIKLNDLSLNSILGKRENLAGIKFLNRELDLSTLSEIGTIPTPLDNYELTILPSMEDANTLFRGQETRTRKNSQCYNRAHVWSFEMSQQNINSGKIWLFFTSKYIRQYDYKWWFHISPYVLVDGQEQEILMDRKFTRNPIPLEEWKNIFMKNNANCPVVQYYSDYRNYQNEEHCYIIKSSMYYWQPYNIENLEDGQDEKLEWVSGELSQAYKNGVRAGARRDF